MNNLDNFRTVGLVLPTPGTREGDSGHVATQMMVSVMSEHHERIRIFTNNEFNGEFPNENVTVQHVSRPFTSASAPLRLLGFGIYQLLLGAMILRHRTELDLVLFGGAGLVVPILAGRLSGVLTVHRKGGGRIRDEVEARAESIGVRLRLYLLAGFVLEKAERYLVDAIIVISESMIDFAGLEDRRSKTYVWDHYFFDLDQFDVGKPFDERGPVIGFAGTISPLKGVHELLTATEQLIEAGHDVTLLMAGDGPSLGDLESKIETRDLDEHVELLGYVPRERMPEIYNRMQLFVLPSKSEGIPKVLLEAMACGTPVVCSDVGGTTDIVVEDECGFVLDDASAQGISDGIKMAFETNLGVMSERCVEYVESNYSFEATSAAYASVVSRIAEESR